MWSKRRVCTEWQNRARCVIAHPPPPGPHTPALSDCPACSVFVLVNPPPGPCPVRDQQPSGSVDPSGIVSIRKRILGFGF